MSVEDEVDLIAPEFLLMRFGIVFSFRLVIRELDLFDASKIKRRSLRTPQKCCPDGKVQKEGLKKLSDVGSLPLKASLEVRDHELFLRGIGPVSQTFRDLVLWSFQHAE